MKNQDMPANSTKGRLARKESEVWDYQVGNDDKFQFVGETKREKAFWQVYSAMIVIKQDGRYFDDFDDTAKFALDAVNAGFKALEIDNEVS